MPDANVPTRASDRRRLAVLAVAGVAVFGVFAFVASGGGGAPDETVGSAPETRAGDADVEVPAREVIARVARRVREILTTYEETQIAEGVARTMIQQAFARAPYGDDELRAALIDALGSDAWSERYVALLAANFHGPADGRFAKILVLRSLDEDARVRDAAVQVIASLREADEEAIGVLHGARETLDPAGQAAILRALVRTRRARAKPLVLEALEGDPDVELRQAASWGLAALDLTPTQTPYPHADIRARLISLLDDEDGLVRMNAAQALGRMGHEATPAIDALVRRLSDPETYVAGHASVALANIGDAAYGPLEAALREGDRSAADDIVWVLRQLGGAEARRIVRSALDHDDPLVRTRAAIGLHAMGAPADAVRGVLVEALGETEDAEVLLAATNGLGRLGKEAAPAREALERLRDHPHDRVRRAVTNLLSGL